MSAKERGGRGGTYIDRYTETAGGGGAEGGGAGGGWVVKERAG